METATQPTPTEAVPGEQIRPMPRRRGFLKMLTMGGMALVGGLAAVIAEPKPEAASADCQGSPCCHLASCTVCSGTCSNFFCPCNSENNCWGRTWWWCTSGSHLIGCGECVKTGNCHAGPWLCSKWWNDDFC
jgi:hypothetical protein